MTSLAPLAPPSAGQRDALRDTLLRAAALPVYAALFDRIPLSEPAIRTDPVAALTRLPLFQPALHAALARESLERRRHDLGGVELSSGTNGPPKRRILSEEDVALDAALVTRLLHLAGVRAADRVAALELAVTPLAAAFLEGCERLGVHDSTALAWRPGADLGPLHRLAPDVLIAPPSLLEHLAGRLTGVRLVIYNGDRLSRDAEARLRATGTGVSSLYGLTETSALGISCPREAGIHLAPEHALFELRPNEAGHELIVTTLSFSMPLLRYPTGDRVRLLPDRCACGSSWPRVEVLGRLGGRFSLFEVELSVDELRGYLLDDTDAPITVRLSDAPGGRVLLTVALPAGRRAQWAALRRRLRAHPLLGYLLGTGLVELRFRMHQPEAGRKVAALVDQRRTGQPADDG